MAHPVRLRLYELLSSEGPATVSRLAARTGAMVGTLSYHLRQLQTYGYIEEAPELASDGRERWWRAVPGGVRWSEITIANIPGGREAANTAQQVVVSRQLKRLRHWHEEREQWDAAWRRAAFSTDMILSLAPSDLVRLRHELDQLIHQYAQRRPTDSAASPATHGPQVFFFAHAFPVDE